LTAGHQRTKGKGPEEQKDSRSQKTSDRSPHGRSLDQDEGAVQTGDSLAGLSVDEHAALLAGIRSDGQRSSMVTQLQQSFGNSYVQRVMERVEATRAETAAVESPAISTAVAPALQRQQAATEEQSTRAPSTEVPVLTRQTVDWAKRDIEDGAKQEAIDLILSEVKSSRMPNLVKCEGKTMKYSGSVDGEGVCGFEYDPRTNRATKIWVHIGDDAFQNVSWLYSSMMHEYQHVNQIIADPRGAQENRPMAEFAAYTWEIFNAFSTGIRQDPAGMEDVATRLYEQAWSQMTGDEKRANQGIYNSAIGFVRGIIGDPSWNP
jgi:hypothetical protein